MQRLIIFSCLLYFPLFGMDRSSNLAKRIAPQTTLSTQLLRSAHSAQRLQIRNLRSINNPTNPSSNPTNSSILCQLRTLRSPNRTTAPAVRAFSTTDDPDVRSSNGKSLAKVGLFGASAVLFGASTVVTGIGTIVGLGSSVVGLGGVGCSSFFLIVDPCDDLWRARFLEAGEFGLRALGATTLLAASSIVTGSLSGISLLAAGEVLKTEFTDGNSIKRIPNKRIPKEELEIARLCQKNNVDENA